MKITIARALKLKSRLVGKLKEVSDNIKQYNSLLVGQERVVDVNLLMVKREKIVDAIINLKIGINNSNLPIQSTIYLLSELKGDVNFLKEINTENGKQINQRSWASEAVVVEKNCVLTYSVVRGLIEQAEKDIDKNQDILDHHNNTTEIDIDESILTL